MKNMLVLALLTLATSTTCSEQDAFASPPTAPVLDVGIVPIGRLGFPIGSYLTIEGRRAEGFKTGVSTLLLDSINGKRPNSPLEIWIDNVVLPPPEFRCTLKGYEMVRMIGTPPAVEQAAKEAGKEITYPQAAWQVFVYFVALSDVMLKDTVLKSNPVAAIRSVLPKGWSIEKVEENAYPPQRAKGKGKAIFLASNRWAWDKAADVVVYIMSADYQDGGKDLTPGRITTNPARLMATIPTAKIYLWGKDGQSIGFGGWHKMSADILKAIVKQDIEVRR